MIILNYDNIVKSYGIIIDETPTLIMELVEGSNYF